MNKIIELKAGFYDGINEVLGMSKSAYEEILGSKLEHGDFISFKYNLLTEEVLISSIKRINHKDYTEATSEYDADLMDIIYRDLSIRSNKIDSVDKLYEISALLHSVAAHKDIDEMCSQLNEEYTNTGVNRSLDRATVISELLGYGLITNNDNKPEITRNGELLRVVITCSPDLALADSINIKKVLFRYDERFVDETNPYYDHSRSNNGGGYHQPKIIFYFKYNNENYSLVIHDTSCKEFGDRISITLFKDNKEVASCYYGTMVEVDDETSTFDSNNELHKLVEMSLEIAYRHQDKVHRRYRIFYED